jgi:tripartite-type tricarboxylate transporter receptor subunit TctC
MIASGMSKRLPWLDLPTFVEAGYPNMEAYNWYGIVAKAGTPPAIVKKLNAEMKRTLEHPATISTMLKRGYIATTTTPAELDTLIRNDYEKWKKVVKASGVQVD